ncbi:MAG: flagellar hook assembly protein FlgD [Desulfohalobiaceae bacterium]|nr:flagellar hook assembly protein FlgD [Desulfohalobiaceae bacterium]
MDGVGGLQAVAAETKAKTGNQADTLGKDDFLNLLVTQLKNQDPLNPSDPTEFTAQLAQYSSLEQLYNINDSLQGLQTMQDGFGRLSALSMIGKEVIAESGSFRYEGRPVEMGFRFEDQVQGAVVSIWNENGRLVDQIEIAEPCSGDRFLQWDGTDQEGRDLPEGTYSLDVTGTTAEGQETAGTPLTASRITGVDFSGADHTLLTTNGSVELAEVAKVNNPTQDDDA